jgi:hypothetical protein
MALTAQFDSDRASVYHASCMDELIPSLTSTTAIHDDELFSAIVILRTKEEFDGTYSSYLLQLDSDVTLSACLPRLPLVS